MPTRLLALLCLAVASAATAQTPRPLVHVIGTGGTIGSSGDYWGGNPSRVPIEELLRVPGLDSVATVGTEQLWNIGSGSIGPDRWLELSRRVSAVLAERPALAGVVVTHGTDTMEETAFFLDLTVGDVRPVVVTGAMRPSNMAGADGPANLTNAVRVARDTAARGRGTMVLMNDRLFPARDVVKTNAVRVDAFTAPERGPIAQAEPEGIMYRGASPRRAVAAFDLRGIVSLPRVDIAYAYGGADGAAVDAFVAAGARGIVIAGLGRGGVTPGLREAMNRARDKGVAIVVGSRTGSGRVPGSMGAGSIGAGDLTPQKARVLLALVLAQAQDAAGTRRLFEAHR